VSLADDLGSAARANDLERVVELLEAATEKDRRAASRKVSGFGIGRDKPAWRLARLGTQTAREATAWWFMFEDLTPEAVVRVVRARGKAFVDTLVRAFEAERFRSWILVRALVKDRVIERPDLGAYTRALVTGVAERSRWSEEDAVYDGLLADPALLDEAVWAIFDVDASQELDRRWTYALTTLAAEGRLDRQRLLDGSLAALQRDFRASSVGWYAALHEALAPDVGERSARIETYLALLASPVPSVAKEGLTGLKAVEELVPGDELARAAAPALTLRQKAVPIDVLRLLGRAAARDAETRPALLATAAEALGHERVDVQEAALKLLEANEPDGRVRSVLLGLAEAASPTLRPRIEALTGVALEAEPAVEVEVPREPARPRLTTATAIGVRAPLEPVRSSDDLIELAAAVLEGQGTGDDPERFLDGVSRLAAERPETLARRAAGLVKRAADLAPEHRTVVGFGAAEIVARVVLAWIAGRPFPARATSGLLGLHALRAGAVAHHARRPGRPRQLLSFPTHAGGWIDPDVLAARRTGEGRFFNRPDRLDLELALLRSTELPPVVLEAKAVWSKPRWGEPQRQLELLPASVPVEVGPVAERLLGTEQPTRWGFRWDSWDGIDALGARWAFSVLPGEPEPAYARALRYAILSRDSASASGHPEVALEQAVDPYVPVSDLGWKAVAAGLLGKPQEVKRAAVDVVVASIEDGRFDAAGLGVAVAWLVQNELGKASRLEQPLRDAGRVSRLHAADVSRAIVAFTAACSSTPAGLVAPLAAAYELAASANLRFDGGAERVALERIAGEVSSGSKLGRAARGLLDG
jgi:Family of unknown function (DUF6493)